MAEFTGGNNRNEHLKPLWHLAHRNNQKPLVVIVRKTKKGARVPVLMG